MEKLIKFRSFQEDLKQGKTKMTTKSITPWNVYNTPYKKSLPITKLEAGHVLQEITKNSYCTPAW